jgi:hypothetical protein
MNYKGYRKYRNREQHSPIKSVKHLQLVMVSLLLVGALLGGSVPQAYAGTTYTVTNTNDNGAGSLRQAILNASAGDTIDFDPNMLPGTITLTSGELRINKSLTIQGPGPVKLAIDGNSVSRVFNITGGNVTVFGVTVQNADIHGAGGGIRNGFATLTVANSIITGNKTRGINFPGGGGSGGSGAGIFNSGGTVTLINSTVNGNTTFDAAALGQGGGLANIHGSMTIINSTVSGNIAARGGGIMNFIVGTLNVTNSTIANNSARLTGDGIHHGGDAVNIINTIIANGHSRDDCFGGDYTSLGHNLDGDGSCGLTDPTDIPSTSPLLGPLQDNGGFTLTHALLAGSPAIDAVPVANCAVTTDQRRVARPQGTACDIGAFEFGVMTKHKPSIEIRSIDGAVVSEHTLAGSFHIVDQSENGKRDELHVQITSYRMRVWWRDGRVWRVLEPECGYDPEVFVTFGAEITVNYSCEFAEDIQAGDRIGPELFVTIYGRDKVFRYMKLLDEKGEGN